MKLNTPVTRNEIVMKKDSILVTRTDLQGKITYVNDEFLKISGFTREEVLGKSHNIIRHSDMPAEIFEDLWASIKSKRPWVGMIKNRAKSGDYYWVHANMVPQFKNGEMYEFLSVRYAPKKGEVDRAEKFYEKLKNKTATCNPTGIKALLKAITEASALKKMVFASIVIAIPLLMFIYNLYLTQDYVTLSGVLFAIVISALVNFQVIFKYSKTLDSTVVMCYRLASKSFGNKLDLKRNDLIGDLYRGLYIH
jgi:methyl-accepting chemotaxis protein